MVKAEELRELNEEEINIKERDLKEELFNLRFQVATQQTTNFARIKQIKKDIARIQTVKNEKSKQ